MNPILTSLDEENPRVMGIIRTSESKPVTNPCILSRAFSCSFSFSGIRNQYTWLKSIDGMDEDPFKKLKKKWDNCVTDTPYNNIFVIPIYVPERVSGFIF